MNQICLYCMFGCTYSKNTTKWGFFREKYPVLTNQDAINFLFHPSEILGLGSVNTFMMVLCSECGPRAKDSEDDVLHSPN